MPNFHCIAASRLKQAPRRQPAAVADGGDIPADATTAASLEAPLLDALGKMNKIMTADFFLSRPSLKQLHGKSTKNIAVKDSSIKGAGKGLFATKNIQRGSIVSFYPAHSLGIELGESQMWVSTNDSDKKILRKEPTGIFQLFARHRPTNIQPTINTGRYLP